MRLVIGLVMGGIASIGRFVVNLLSLATCDRDSTRTVTAYASDAATADGQSLITVPADLPAFSGARLATTVEDGAALGAELWESPTISAEWVDEGGGVYSLDGSQVGFPDMVVSNAAFITGNIFQHIITVLSTSAGVIRTKAGNTNGSARTSIGVFTEDITQMAGAGHRIQADPDFVGSIKITDVGTDVSFKQALPTWLSTDINGLPLTGIELDVADAATNLLLNSDAPVTQTVAVGTGDYTLQVVGSGSALASDNTATSTGFASATEGSPNTFNVTGAGTVDITVTGSLDFFQLEAGDFASPIIITAGASASRVADKNTIPTPSVLSITQGTLRVPFTPNETGQIDKFLVSLFIDATHTIDLSFNATQVTAEYIDGANTDSAVFTYTHTQNVDGVADIYWDADLDEIGVRAGTPAGVDGETFITGTFAGMTALPETMDLGHQDGAGFFKCSIANKGITAYASAEEAGWV